MAHLPSEQINALIQVLVENGLVKKDILDALAAGLPALIAAQLSEDDTPLTRLQVSLGTLNDLGPTADGRLPLSIALAHFTSIGLQPVTDEARRLMGLLEVQATPVARPITVIDALGHIRVIGNDLFAARDPLRGRLGELARDDGPAAVVVNGSVKVGKSHTRTLLAHAAHATGAFRLAWVEVRSEEAADFTADWLVEELVHSLVPGATGLPPRRTPVARWLGDLTSWAFDQIARSGTAVPVWLLIDGIGQASVTDEVRGIVDRMAAQVALQTGPVRMRLVLINADTDAIRRRCVAEEERLEHLTAVDAQEALKRLAPDTFPELWPVVEATLSSQQAPTTPMVSAVIRESLK